MGRKVACNLQDWSCRKEFQLNPREVVNLDRKTSIHPKQMVPQMRKSQLDEYVFQTPEQKGNSLVWMPNSDKKLADRFVLKTKFFNFNK